MHDGDNQLGTYRISNDDLGSRYLNLEPHGPALTDTPVINVSSETRRGDTIGSTLRVAVNVILSVARHDSQCTKVRAKRDLPVKPGFSRGKILDATFISDLSGK
jgi:hypothetical protein